MKHFSKVSSRPKRTAAYHFTSAITSALECQPNRQLHLQRVADALSEVSIKVEQARRGNRVLAARRPKRIDEVVIVKCIEHVELRYQPNTFAKVELAADTPVKRKIVVVFPQRIAIRYTVYQFEIS